MLQQHRLAEVRFQERLGCPGPHGKAISALQGSYSGFEQEVCVNWHKCCMTKVFRRDRTKLYRSAQVIWAQEEWGCAKTQTQELKKSEICSIFFSHVGCSGDEGSLSTPESMLHPPKDETGRKETPTVLLQQPLQGLPLHLWSSMSDWELVKATLPHTHRHTQPPTATCSCKTDLSSSPCGWEAKLPLSHVSLSGCTPSSSQV